MDATNRTRAAEALSEHEAEVVPASDLEDGEDVAFGVRVKDAPLSTVAAALQARLGGELDVVNSLYARLDLAGGEVVVLEAAPSTRRMALAAVRAQLLVALSEQDPIHALGYALGLLDHQDQPEWTELEEVMATLLADELGEGDGPTIVRLEHVVVEAGRSLLRLGDASVLLTADRPER